MKGDGTVWPPEIHQRFRQRNATMSPIFECSPSRVLGQQDPGPNDGAGVVSVILSAISRHYRRINLVAAVGKAITSACRHPQSGVSTAVPNHLFMILFRVPSPSDALSSH